MSLLDSETGSEIKAARADDSTVFNYIGSTLFLVSAIILLLTFWISCRLLKVERELKSTAKSS